MRTPARAAQAEVFSSVCDERLMLGRHVRERVQARVGRLQLGDDGALGEQRERVGGQASLSQRLGPAQIRRSRSLFDRENARDFRSHVGDVSQRDGAGHDDHTGHRGHEPDLTSRRFLFAGAPGENEAIHEADEQTGEFGGTRESAKHAVHEEHCGTRADAFHRDERHCRCRSG